MAQAARGESCGSLQSYAVKHMLNRIYVSRVVDMQE